MYTWAGLILINQIISWLYTLDIITSPSFTTERLPTDYAMLQTASMDFVFKWLGNCGHLHWCHRTQQAYDQEPVTPAFNDNHIIYDHMDVQ